MCEQVSVTDRDAAGDADAVDRKAHHRRGLDTGLAQGMHFGGGHVRSAHSDSPKRSAINRVSASIASSSSGPSVSTVRFEPLAAASIITPMMLLALTRRPLRAS